MGTRYRCNIIISQLPIYQRWLLQPKKLSNREYIYAQSCRVKEDGLGGCIYLETYLRAGEQEQIVRILSQQLRAGTNILLHGAESGDTFRKLHYTVSFTLMNDPRNGTFDSLTIHVPCKLSKNQQEIPGKVCGFEDNY